MVRWQRWAPAAPFGSVVVLYVLYRQVYHRAGIEGLDLSVPEEAWQSLEGPQDAVASLGARLTWGIAILAFSLAFLAAL